MSGLHPSHTDRLASSLMAMLIDLTKTTPPPEVYDIILKNYKTLLNTHACQAAGIMGSDPSRIHSLVWYKTDGWDHGGCAITWQEHAKELAAELATKNALLERAVSLLEEYHSELDCSGETDSRAAKEIRNILTDIEHN